MPLNSMEKNKMVRKAIKPLGKKSISGMKPLRRMMQPKKYIGVKEKPMMGGKNYNLQQ